MKLYPKARPVRIKLNVGGEEHSSLDSLRANFNVEEVLKLYEAGGLRNWLRQINRQDISEELEKIKDNSKIEKYRKCIHIFFEDNKGGNRRARFDSKKIDTTFDDIILNWQDKYPVSYRCLLDTLVRISNDQYLISLNCVSQMSQKAEKKSDVECLSLLSEYLYRHINRSLELIRAFKMKSSYITQREFDSMSIQLKKEWNINLKHNIERKGEYRNILRNMFDHPLLKEYRNDIIKKIDSLDIYYNKDGISITDIDLQKGAEFIEKVCNDILNYNLRVSKREYANIEIVSKNPHSSWKMEISSEWYRFHNILNVYTETSLNSELIEKWCWLIVKSYLYKFVLDNQMVSKIDDKNKKKEFDIILNFLNSHNGRKGFSTACDSIKSICNASSFKSKDLIRKKILQSSLYACILMASSSQDIYNLMKDLKDSCYRPALLHFKSELPKNKIEKEFMTLNNFERIPFIAQHILDL